MVAKRLKYCFPLVLCLSLLSAVAAQGQSDLPLNEISDNTEGNTSELLSAAIQNQLSLVDKEIAQLERIYQENVAQIKALETALEDKVGDDQAVLSYWRQAALDAKKLFSSSLISSQLPNRAEKLADFDQANAVPDPEQFAFLFDALLEEIQRSASVESYMATVVAKDGVVADIMVTRIGKFAVVRDDEYLRFHEASESLYQLPHSLPWQYQRLLANVGSADTVQRVAIDPSMGSVINSYAKHVSTVERIRQGGWVGVIILLLGIFGTIVFVIRFVFLFAIGRRIKRQLSDSEINTNNPLGRCWQACHDKAITDFKLLELKLDEVIIGETAAIERWQAVLKLVAAVAPLLGLLGTVIGMIETFQSIAVVGSNDPKFMAAGISKALVTTMLGLVVAVPMLLLHSVLAGKSQSMIEVLEEQSAGKLAERMASKA